MEANRALYDVKEQLSVFYAQQASALQEIKEFRGRPGWNEFEQILLEYPSLKDPDNEVEIEGVESRLSEWSLKWKTSWKKTLEDYYNLVDKCSHPGGKESGCPPKVAGGTGQVSYRRSDGSVGGPRKRGEGNLLGSRNAG